MAGIDNVRPIGVGAAGAGGAASSTGTSTKKSEVFNKPIAIVYGTASVKMVRLTVEPAGTGSTQMDSGSTISLPLARVQIAACMGPGCTVKSIAYEKWLYGAGGISFNYMVSGAPTYSPTFTAGNPATVGIWSPHASSGPEMRTPYGHVVVMRAETLAVPDGSTSIKDMTATIGGLFASHLNTERTLSGTTYDAHPLDVITDLIENKLYGLGRPAGTVSGDVGSDGTAASSYRRHCQARAYWVALAIDTSAKVEDIVAQLLMATNAIGYWDAVTFRIIPLADKALTANSATYTPDLRAMSLADDDFIRDGGDDPIVVRRTSWDSVSNVVPVEWSIDSEKLDDLGHTYQDAELVTAEDMDTANASQFMVRRADTVSLPCIRSEAHALEISRILAQTSCYRRSTFEFKVGPRLGATICPADLLLLTHEAMGLGGQLVRVTSTDEDPDGVVTIQAVEWPTDAVIAPWSIPHAEDGI